MKKITSIIALSAFLVFGMSSCFDGGDFKTPREWLDTKPTSEIILDEFWKSEGEVESVVAACYRALSEDAVVYRMIIWGELRSDNMTSGSSIPNERYDIQRILEGEISSDNGYCSWASFYTVINYCNTVLEYAPVVLVRDDNFTELDLNRVKAEVLTLRALAYFYLVRTFNEVPLIVKASISDSQKYELSKDTKHAVMDTIIKDLNWAKQYARTDWGRLEYNKNLITLNTVNALLADVYLWDEQYENCVLACNEVLKDSKLELVEEDRMLGHVFFMGNSTESIFEIPQYNDKNESYRPIYNLYGSAGDPVGELSFPANLAYDPENDVIGAYSPFVYKVSTTLTESKNDVRAKISYQNYSGLSLIFKYSGKSRVEEVIKGVLNVNWTYRNDDDIPNWIIYRLSDVLLMKAEALVQLEGAENLAEALSLVNKTYLRSNETADSLVLANYNDKTLMEQLVLRERHREFLFEGKRWFDLVRMARRENTTNTLNDFVNHKSSGNAVSLGAALLNAMYMPIYEREIEINDSLTQNPYYDEKNSSSSR